MPPPKIKISDGLCYKQISTNNIRPKYKNSKHLGIQKTPGHPQN